MRELLISPCPRLKKPEDEKQKYSLSP